MPFCHAFAGAEQVTRPSVTKLTLSILRRRDSVMCYAKVDPVDVSKRA